MKRERISASSDDDDDGGDGDNDDDDDDGEDVDDGDDDGDWLIQAAVCRCSQPLSGFSGRCQEDEMMLQAVMKSNPGSDYIYVVDTRPKVTHAHTHT